MNTTAALKKTKKQLHESGFKLTPQREATLLVLLENEKDHLSAEEIFFFVRKKNSEIGLATVYRTLEILTDLNDLRKEGAKHFHHHLLCLECGNIEEVEEDLLGSVEEIVEQKYHFLVKDHRLTFHGVCQKCQSKAE